MGIINILDSELSNKIAAGEVVERPASVIKELIENSIDAGATSITVEIHDGGISYMRVSDNGSGMKREDAEIAFLRHATSKIKTADDLDAIYTLGFRGEALSSIAAVAQVDLFTKTQDTDEGVHVHAEGGEITLSDSAGTPVGTSITVNNLFFNTPARMKFLKRNSTEAGYITDIITRFILSHPEISFKFINGKKEQLFSAGNNRLTDCIYTVYGKDYAKAVIDVDYEHNGIKLTGAIGKSEVSRPNRNFQSFFINGRYIKSPVIIRAVEEAYKNQIMIGKFPMAVLNLEINPSLIDINVHPTKLEVKFSDDKSVYETVYFAVKNALYKTVNIPKIESKETTETLFDRSHEQLVKTIDTASVFRNERPAYENTVQPAETEQKNVYAPPIQKIEEFPVSTDSINIGKETNEDNEKIKKNEKNKQDNNYVIEPVNTNEIRPVPIEKNVVLNQDSKPYILETDENNDDNIQSALDNISDIQRNSDIIDNYRLIGQIFGTYIIAEHENEMLIIDQHAAHERLKYEELKNGLADGTIQPQILLVPAVVTLNAVEYGIFNDNKEFFFNIGFETEDFGDNSILVRTAPTDMDEDAISSLIIELLSQLDSSKRELITAKEDRALYTVACKAAVKANHYLHTDEMKRLLDSVFSLDNINTCPHGRPIIISMSKKELEKSFKRIV